MVEAKSAEDLATERKEAAEKVAQAKIAQTNATRSGKGTRLQFGWTRGKNSQLFYYEQFDRSQSDTVPSTISEFSTLVKAENELQLVGYMLDGWNAEAYSNSSDPANEFVKDSWPEAVQKSFKIALKNFASASGMSLEAAAKVLVGSIDAGLASK